ncbi:MAG: PepSY-associated TM helix domain-containing protein [Hyphomicrobiales bacterium]
MKKLKWRKILRVTHRDLGYFFAAMTLIYALSGIAINHLDDWNPNYIIHSKEVKTNINAKADKNEILTFLQEYELQDDYKSHYSRKGKNIKVFLKNGTVFINTQSKTALIENTSRRPFFRQVNYLHYNPIRSWTWFSDIFAVALIVLAVSGLFMVRGKKGFVWRGVILFVVGLLIPVVYLLLYF